MWELLTIFNSMSRKILFGLDLFLLPARGLSVGPVIKKKTLVGRRQSGTWKVTIIENWLLRFCAIERFAR
jgi:hypothetical protein